MRDERVAVARIDLPRIGDALGAAPRPAFERHAGRARRDAERDQFLRPGVDRGYAMLGLGPGNMREQPCMSNCWA